MNRNDSLNLPFRLVKIMDIGYITVIYFLIGIICAFILNNILHIDDIEEHKTKTVPMQLLEIIGILWLNGIIIYIVRNLVELIPSPFNGMYGLIHVKVKELQNATVFVFALLYFQYPLRQRINYLYNSITKKSLTFKEINSS
jgi:hypothetical protein